MTQVKISAETELQEAQAMVAYLQNRNLVLAQAVREAIQTITERDNAIVALSTQTAPETCEGEVTQ